jgi:peptidyl-prolyl cis-trans isomerase A (cyclophilin A)
MQLRLLAIASASVALASCQGRSETPQTQTQAADGAAQTPVAPDTFRVAFETGKGRFVVEAIRAWAPIGVDRFHQLVTIGYFDKVKFFRVLPNFMAQFGISGDPEMNKTWGTRAIRDDPVKESNRKGTISYATAGPNTRSTQLFINTKDNRQLDGMGFAPIGRVIEGIDVVTKFYSGYGEGAPEGRGPNQTIAEANGNAYMNGRFPRLDSVITARIIPR